MGHNLCVTYDWSSTMTLSITIIMSEVSSLGNADISLAIKAVEFSL